MTVETPSISPPPQQSVISHSHLKPTAAAVKMGLHSTPPSASTDSHYHTHKAFLFCNYILLGAASSCIFLTLSLRLVPSAAGVALILLHALTIAGAVVGCAAAASGTGKWFGSHLVATVVTAIFQGSVSVLIFTRTASFLTNLNSYVRPDDGSVILKLAGGLCVLMFCLEWVVLALAFMLKYYVYAESDAPKQSGRVRQEEDDDKSNWPWHLQIQSV